MKKRSEVTQSIDRRLIVRLRIYIIVMLFMFAVIVYEVLQGRFSIQFAISGIIFGLVVGIIVSRMYNLSWDEEANNVIGSIDTIGAVILVSYLIFIFTKSYFLGYVVQGASLFAIIIGITAGTMLGRVLATRHGINEILKALEI
jgi:hypothetical protein